MMLSKLKAQAFEVLSFCILNFIGNLNNICCNLEDLLFTNKGNEEIIFIVGPPRSGTTNLFECLFNEEHCSSAMKVDVFANSYIIRSLFLRPMQAIISILMGNQLDAKGHRTTADSVAELHQFLYYKRRINFFMLFPNLEIPGTGPITLQDTNDIKRIIRRKLYWDNKKIFIGKALAYTVNTKLLREVFPGCKIIMCNRKKEDVFQSYAGLWFNMASWKALETSRREFLFRKAIRTRLCPAIAAIEDGLVSYDYLVDFERWKTEPQFILDEIRDTFQLSYRPMFQHQSEVRGIRATSPEAQRALVEGLASLKARKEAKKY